MAVQRNAVEWIERAAAYAREITRRLEGRSVGEAKGLSDDEIRARLLHPFTDWDEATLFDVFETATYAASVCELLRQTVAIIVRCVRERAADAQLAADIRGIPGETLRP